MSYKSFTLFATMLLTLSQSVQAKIINFTFSVEQSYEKTTTRDENFVETTSPTKYANIEPQEVKASYTLDFSHKFEDLHSSFYEDSFTGQDNTHEWSIFRRNILVTDYSLNTPFTDLIQTELIPPTDELSVTQSGIRSFANSVFFQSRIYKDLATGAIDNNRSITSFVLHDGFYNNSEGEQGVLTNESFYFAASYIVFEDALVDFDNNYFNTKDILALLNSGTQTWIRYNETVSNTSYYGNGVFDRKEHGVAGDGLFTVKDAIVVPTANLAGLFAVIAFLIARKKN